MKHRVLLAGFLFLWLGLSLGLTQNIGPGDGNCFTILVGKKASYDSSVLLAHNEDDYNARVVNWYKVPQEKHSDGEEIILHRGAHLKQAAKTFSFIWLEMPGFEFSDSYMNQWGVTIVSNQCPSKETEGERLNGGIGYFLRRIMAQRARTAREAVKIGGKLIEQFGYAGNGRTYCIADPNEAWMLAVVNGKHWVAERVPDDAIAIIPNYYTIGQVDLQDTLNFMGSPDLIQYAIQKGWYDPHAGKPFNFRLVYGDPLSLAHYSNIARHWASLNLLAARHFDFSSQFPFAVKPKSPVTVLTLMEVLRNHYEGTELEMNPAYNHGNPHENVIMRICSQTNRMGMVAQLRSWLPADVGNILWIAPRRPCVQPFVPWYWGITEIPPEYTSADYKKALQIHFLPETKEQEYAASHAYWSFTKYAAKIDSNYAQEIPTVRAEKEAFQNAELSEQKTFEKRVLRIYEHHPNKARSLLTKYTKKWAEKALQRVRR